MIKGIVKVPSYLVDMVMLENKTLMIKSDDVVISKFDKKTIAEKIRQIESKEFDGMLYEKAIKYRLIRIDTNKTKTPVAQEVAI